MTYRKNSKKNKTNQQPFGVLFAVLLSAILLSGCQSSLQASSEDPSKTQPTVFQEGTVLQAQDISGKTPKEAADIGRNYIENNLKKLEISVKFEQEKVVLKDKDFTYKEMLHEVLSQSLSSEQPQELPLPYVIDLSDSGKQKIMEAAQKAFTKMQNATVEEFDSSSGKFKFTKEKEGKQVDIDKTLKNIRQLLMRKQGGALQAEFIKVKPKTTQKDLQKRFGLIATYSTVSTNTANGNSNMALALSRVNGTKLEPGEVFSYNGTIGNSTSAAEGYLPAGGITGGAIVQMYGGGICQGSTTLYNAVIRAGLEIVERECHAFEATYVPTGLDAMVDYGNYDFKFRNNTDYPVYLQGWMDGVTLYASVYGVKSDEWDTIEVSSSQVDSYPVPDTVSYTEDANLPKGEYVLYSAGRLGVLSVASRSYYKNGELVKTENLPDSYYPPKGRVYTYGPGTDIKKIDITKDRGKVDEKPKKTEKPKLTPKPVEPPPEPQKPVEPAPEQPVKPEPNPAPAPEPSQSVPETPTVTDSSSAAADSSAAPPDQESSLVTSSLASQL